MPNTGIRDIRVYVVYRRCVRVSVSCTVQPASYHPYVLLGMHRSRSITAAEPARPMHAGSSRSGDSWVRLVGQALANHRVYDPRWLRAVQPSRSHGSTHVAAMLQPIISTAHYGVRSTTSGQSVGMVILMMTHIPDWGRGRRLLHRAMLPT